MTITENFKQYLLLFAASFVIGSCMAATIVYVVVNFG